MNGLPGISYIAYDTHPHERQEEGMVIKALNRQEAAQRIMRKRKLCLIDLIVFNAEVSPYLPALCLPFNVNPALTHHLPEFSSYPATPSYAAPPAPSQTPESHAHAHSSIATAHRSSDTHAIARSVSPATRYRAGLRWGRSGRRALGGLLRCSARRATRGREGSARRGCR